MDICPLHNKQVGCNLLKTNIMDSKKEVLRFMILPINVIEKLNREEVVKVKGGGNPPVKPPINNGTGCKC